MVKQTIYKGLSCVIVLMAMSISIQAQVYSCDFESDTENSAWVRNYVRRATT